MNKENLISILFSNIMIMGYILIEFIQISYIVILKMLFCSMEKDS
nr:MAG TPA: hypothetical protein [Caudoviricetes sp.]